MRLQVSAYSTWFADKQPALVLITVADNFSFTCPGVSAVASPPPSPPPPSPSPPPCSSWWAKQSSKRHRNKNKKKHYYHRGSRKMSLA